MTWPSTTRSRRLNLLFCAAGFLALAVASGTPAQNGPGGQNSAASQAAPIAIVPIDSSNTDQAATVTGAFEVTGGRAIIAASGSITSGNQTTRVILPHRGELRVCASTSVKLASDSSAAQGETPGLLMAMDQGAVEMSFATTSGAGRDSDILLTPDFRILIAGPGAAEVKVRLGQHGDTCVDNAGANAPYVLVSSVFDGGAYRVQPGQRVMFQHGSLHEVVDQEKEPCGCPPAAPKGNEFPLAQSEGLAPLPKPAPASANGTPGTTEAVAPLVYKSAEHTAQAAAGTDGASNQGTNASANANTQQPAGQKKPGLFSKMGRFFRRIFGAE